MPYLMGGFPDLEKSRAVGEAYADAGADLVELGVPYSDPLADGPVIHAAGSQALSAGATVAGVLDVGAALAPRLPVIVMCYANLLYARGIEGFAAALGERGIAGLIVPDLPLEEAPDVLAACDAAGVALVPLVAPSTPDDRLAQIGAPAPGVLFPGSRAGTTAARRPARADRGPGSRVPLHGLRRRDDGRATLAVRGPVRRDRTRRPAHRRARRRRLRHHHARARPRGRRRRRRGRHRGHPAGAR